MRYNKAIRGLNLRKKVNLERGGDLATQMLEGKAVYRCRWPVGQGSMGTVYLADVVDSGGLEDLPEVVAIKILDESLKPRGNNYRREVSLMREINHPSVVRVHDWQMDGVPKFAVFDYYRNGSVSDRFYREGPLELDEALCLMRDMLEALVATHRHGVLHLDIKPGNILINDDEHYLLTDFGVATSLFVGEGRRVVGTPAFMSPEQARGEFDKIDARADLFSLGATMWQLMVGRYPFKEVTGTGILKERASEPLPSIIPHLSDQGRGLGEVIDSMLAFHPRHRPGSAAEVLARLESLTEGELDLYDDDTTGHRLTGEERSRLRKILADPILIDLLKRWGKHYRLRRFDDQEVICAEGERSFDVYVLLEGEIEVWQRDKLLAVERGEGLVIGEIAALIGSSRTATLKARGPAFLALLKAAELEQATRAMPGLGVRIMKRLAQRLHKRDIQEEI